MPWIDCACLGRVERAKPLGALATLLWLFVGLSSSANAEFVLAPPIVGPDVKPTVSAIERAIVEQLRAARLEPMKRTPKETARLVRCENKMSCLAKAAAELGATYVIHTILGLRNGEILVQQTVIDAKEAKGTDVARTKAANEAAAIEVAVKDATRKSSAALLRQSGTLEDTIALAPETTPPPMPTPQKDATPPIHDAGQSARVEPPPTMPPESKTPAYVPVPPVHVPPPIAIPSASQPLRRGANYWVYGIGGASVLAGVASAVSFALAHSDASARDGTPQVRSTERQELHDSAVAKQTVGIACAGAGGAALVVALVLAIVDRHDETPKSTGQLSAGTVWAF